MHVLLQPLGSHGDVHPFIGLGKVLKRRGHRVSIQTVDRFEPLARAQGFEFAPLGDDEWAIKQLDNPDLWHPIRAFSVVAQFILRSLGPVYEHIAAHYVPGETVVVSGALAFGARIAQEKLGVPQATVHLQPSVLRSAVDPPLLPGFPRWTPRRAWPLLYRLIDAAVIDRLLAPETNAFRAGLGLPPVRRLLDRWWNSPDLILGLFPAWFAPPPRDWPPQLRLLDFPLYDESDVAPPDPDLESFLASGEPPIVFTAGSANKHASRFFAASAEACTRLGRRGLLLSQFPELLPRALPAGVRHVAYEPLGRLLPRAAALVFHGGIGTASQGLRAGLPLVVTPYAHDQHDNAARLERLGVARTIAASRYTAGRAAATLADLLASREVAARCRAIAARFVGAQPLEEAADAIEALVSREWPRPSTPARA